jgi:trehalose utilization protein
VPKTVRVTIWNEGRHEKSHPEVAKVYPKGIHGALAAGLAQEPGLKIVKTATLDEDEEHGLSEKVLAKTDVLTWWGHMAHHEVTDAIFRKLMGTGCGLKWREAAEQERLWVVRPGHPIVEGLGEYLELPHTEMYGEFFDIPQPDELILISWFEGGDVFRSGCCWNRGGGKVFYFRPGHETFPIYYDKNVLRLLGNACRWAARPAGSSYSLACPNVTAPLNPIPKKK